VDKVKGLLVCGAVALGIQRPNHALASLIEILFLYSLVPARNADPKSSLLPPAFAKWRSAFG
jgi:hypothetical protein